jgi:hypothetical protein
MTTGFVHGKILRREDESRIKTNSTVSVKFAFGGGNFLTRRSMRSFNHGTWNQRYNMVAAAGASDNVVLGLGGHSNPHKYASVALRALRRHHSFNQRVMHEVLRRHAPEASVGRDHEFSRLRLLRM